MQGAAGASPAPSQTGVAGASPIETGMAGMNGVAGMNGSTPGPGGMEPTANVCGPNGDRYRPATIEGVRTVVRGTWALCSALGLFGQPQDGVYVGPDDKWVLLKRENGVLVAQTGPENQGHVEYLDMSDVDHPRSFGAYFDNDLGSRPAASFVFSDVPRIMNFVLDGINDARYARVGPSGPNEAGTENPPGATPDAIKQPTGSVSCGPRGATYKPQTLEEQRQAFHGTWVQCSQFGLFMKPHDGIYIGPDDRRVLLDRRGDKLVPQTGLENKGRLDYLPGISQVNVESDLGFSTVTIPKFNDRPRLVVFADEFEPVTYGLVR
jgi:hypothetical protein